MQAAALPFERLSSVNQQGFSRQTRRTRAGLSLLLFSALGLAAQAQSAMSPTAAEPDPAIDAAWQKASSAYDGRRAELLADVNQYIAAGPFRADWQSLSQSQVPEWYKDAKFGVFIHWGVYSVPAFGSEWYPRLMYMQGSPENLHEVATYGPLTKFGYKDFIPMFKAEHYDPEAWAKLFKAAGFKYVVPVFEHHDGFTMYDSGLSDWTAVKMGPHRDLVGDLAKAIRAEGLHLGASSHRVEHDWFMEGGRREESDVNDPKYAAFYGPAHQQRQGAGGDAGLLDNFTYVSQEWVNDWLARDAEIVEKYHPDIMYFDWWIGQPDVRRNLAKFAAFYYNESLAEKRPVGVINYKTVAMEQGSGVLDIERGQLPGIRKLYWQTDTSISNKSWGYIENDTFKTPEFVVHQLVDIVSKNGNLLINIGPRSDGTIPDEVQHVLLDIGAWLNVNGEAIYGTRPWRVYGEGPTEVEAGQFHDTDTKPYTAEDFRFTTKGDTLYAIELGWPTTGEVTVHSLASQVGAEKVRSVTLLGSSATIGFTQEADGLHLQLPVEPAGKMAYAFKVEFK
jgi:alpha-L-fucosidase